MELNESLGGQKGCLFERQKGTLCCGGLPFISSLSHTRSPGSEDVAGEDRSQSLSIACEAALEVALDVCLGAEKACCGFCEL